MLTRDEAIAAAHGALKDHVAHLTAMLIGAISADPSPNGAEAAEAHMRAGLQVVKRAEAAAGNLIDEAFPAAK